MVQGGLSILSGGLTLEQQPFSVGTLHADGTAGNLVDPLLSASATSKHYAGHMLSLTGPTEGGEKMKFLSFQRASSSDVSGGNSTAAASATALFEVKGSGDMDSAGGAVFRGSQGLEVHGSSTLRGRVSLHKVVLVPEVVSAVSDTTATSVGMDGDAVGGDGSQQSSTLRVTVPTTVTYAVIAPADRSSLQGATTPSASSSTVSGSADGKRGVEVVFAAPEGFPSAAAGRVVLVCNLDELTTSGDCEVPPQSTVMMLFDGQRWVSVDALKAPMHVRI